MADIVPKIADVKHLQDLGKVFALPMLAVAYILQTGLSIGWDDTVWFGITEELEQHQVVARYIAIVVAKSIWISFFGSLFYVALAGLHLYSNELLLPLAAIILFVFGLLGFFNFELVSNIGDIHRFWAYSCFVWGFFLLSMKEQIDNM